jgi:hypothetical protein
MRAALAEVRPDDRTRSLEKFTYLEQLGVQQIGLSMLPPGRARILTGDGRRRPTWSSRGSRHRGAWRRCWRTQSEGLRVHSGRSPEVGDDAGQLAMARTRTAAALRAWARAARRLRPDRGARRASQAAP